MVVRSGRSEAKESLPAGLTYSLMCPSYLPSQDTRNVQHFSNAANSGVFHTRDLALAAAIIHEENSFIGIDRSKQRAEFIFNDSDNLRAVVQRYWRNELLCPAQSLLAALRRVKQLLYDSEQ